MNRHERFNSSEEAQGELSDTLCVASLLSSRNDLFATSKSADRQ